ncbi:MAG: hypothetical protein ACO1SX_29475 [Actinomycetota bacterium]
MQRAPLFVFALVSALATAVVPTSAAQAPAKGAPPATKPRGAGAMPYRDDLPRSQGLDLNALISDTQKQSTDPGRMTLVWWFPEEFWRTALRDNKEVTPEQVEEFVDVMRPYTLMVVADGLVQDDGRINYTPEAQLRASLRMRGFDGVNQPPIAAAKIGEGPQIVVDVIKPILTNMLGPMGENMRFFFFPGAGKDGKRLADTRSSGQLSLCIGPREYRWRLPLGSIIPPKQCPTCTEFYSGAFKFCPLDGVKLPNTEAPAAR